MPKKMEQIFEAREVDHISRFTQEDKEWINGRMDNL